MKNKIANVIIWVDREMCFCIFIIESKTEFDSRKHKSAGNCSICSSIYYFLKCSSETRILESQLFSSLCHTHRAGQRTGLVDVHFTQLAHNIDWKYKLWRRQFWFRAGWQFFSNICKLSMNRIQILSRQIGILVSISE